MFIAVTLSAATAGVLIAQQDVPNSGSVGGNITSTVDIKVNNDPDATIICTEIDWGNLNQATPQPKQSTPKLFETFLKR